MSSQKAISTIEAVLILPIVLLFLIGIADFGRIMAFRFVYNRALQATVRAAGIETSDCAVDVDSLKRTFADVVGSYGFNRSPSDLTTLFCRDPVNLSYYVSVNVTLEVACFFCPLLGISPSTFDFRRVQSTFLENQNQCNGVPDCAAP